MFKTFLARVTRIGSFLRVDTFVNYEACFNCKALPAKVTRIGSFSRVDTFVTYET